ncbi:MAG TPA: hypothetical protein VNO50_12240 [Pyrinomonadaceae bacterium]|nr:hypothetical protein [Pyrinomonadaceae bacterium]
MNCQNFESIINELVRNQIMEAGVREQAQLHSSSCASCTVRLHEEQALTQGLRELTLSMRSESASVESEATVATAFRAHHARLSGAGSVSTSAPLVVFSKGIRRYWSYAAAAGILLAVALGFVANRLWKADFSPEPSVASRENSPAVNPAPAKALPIDLPVASGMPIPDGATLEDISPTPRSNSLKQPSASRRRMAKHTKYTANSVTVQSLNILAPAMEVATEFIPIGFANAASVQEGGQVVRLEMSRYAMARFGVPINQERYDEMVKADVWVGADGLARAIRFVQ